MANQDHLEIIKKGVSNWNEWMASNPDVIPDLVEADLSGLDLSGINLSKADLSNSNIRGTNFTKAVLNGTNFSKSNTTRKKITCAELLSTIPISWIATVFALFSAIILVSLSWSLANNFIPSVQLEGRISLLLLTIGCLIFFLAKTSNKFTRLLTSFACFSLTSWLFASPLEYQNIFILIAIFNSVLTVGSIISGWIFQIVYLILGALSLPKYKFSFSFVLFINFFLVFLMIFDNSYPQGEISDYEKLFLFFNHKVEIQKFIFTLICSNTLAFACDHFARVLLSANNKFSKLLRNSGAIFSTRFGTSFRYADLTEANFCEANLDFTDFREAVLIRVCWTNSKNLMGIKISENREERIEIVRAEGTILADQDVRELLVTGTQNSKNFRNKNLRGAYLVSLNLSEYDFSEADLSEANLKGTNLSGANLAKVQASGTSFQAANFTGALGLSSWGIDRKTNLDDIDCQYIFLNDSTQERRPSDVNKDFKSGDFKRLFQKALETVDLIFNKEDGIDFEALLLSIENLRIEAEGIDITIQAIEQKSDGSFLVRIRVPLEANKSEIEKFIKREYDLQLKCIEDKYKFQLQIKDEQIKDFRLQRKDDRKKNTELLRTVAIMAENQANQAINNFYGTVSNVANKIEDGGQQQSVQCTNTIEQKQKQKKSRGRKI
jgi:uncharacterized protein YjbI with pentapeptide repeats